VKTDENVRTAGDEFGCGIGRQQLDGILHALCFAVLFNGKHVRSPLYTDLVIQELRNSGIEGILSILIY
jgi:hypothetical protein